VTARRLTYERIVAERDRIRAARAFFARQLGPLPAVAGVSVALVGAFSEEISHKWLLLVALVLFALMVLVSVLYSRMPAYRDLRAHRVRNETMEEGVPGMQPAAWYDAEIKLEHSIYSSRVDGTNSGRLPRRLPRRNLTGDLQAQLDKERLGVFVVQGLFLCVIACLVLARVAP
jgi:hypothetical protein